MKKNITKIKMTLLIVIPISIFIMQSCIPQDYMAKYNVILSSVESPANTKQQFGKTKIICFQENGQNKYSYEDDYIEISWYVGTTTFYFTLKNKSEHAIKINWDDIAYVDIHGSTSKIIHAGIKYNEKEKSQPATVIPKNATISDCLVPSDNIFYQDGIGWRESNLVPSFYTSIENMNNKAPSYIGMKMSILIPIIIENVQNDYTFEFKIDTWENKDSE